ncbi:MAG: LysM domain-containing protein [Phycisphaerales bacterium]|nr:MAG: LysM domain-containing protein [Phycisphaerales bacterium]
MTREHKLALIIGFSLVLIVGVLVSDHLSQASRVQLDGSGSADETMVALAPIEPVRPAPRSAYANPAPAPAVERLHDRIGAAAPEPQVARTLDLRPPETVEPAIASGDPDGWRVEVPSLELALEEPVASPSRDSRSRALRENTLAFLEDAQNGATELIHQGGNLLERFGQVPVPSALQVVQRETPNAVLRYTVQNNDTLFRIAEAHYGDGHLWRALADANEGRVGSNGAVRVGVSLVLPDMLNGKPVLGGWNSAGTQAEPPAQASAPTPVPTPAPTPSTAPAAGEARGARTYTVQRGDTLGRIAQRELGTVRRMREIIDLNRDRIDDADDIRVGMTLRLPPR